MPVQTTEPTAVVILSYLTHPIPLRIQRRGFTIPASVVEPAQRSALSNYASKNDEQFPCFLLKSFFSVNCAKQTNWFNNPFRFFKIHEILEIVVKQERTISQNCLCFQWTSLFLPIAEPKHSLFSRPSGFLVKMPMATVASQWLGAFHQKKWSSSAESKVRL